MPSVTVAIAADHAGHDLKELLKPELEAMSLIVLDLGTHGPDSVDYPDFADAVAAALREGRAGRGLLVCGTGIGIAMAANRHRHVRAAVCHDATGARLARQHNDANVLALGARLVGPEVARECVRIFFTTKFEGGRHARRIDKIS
jgi:ribose 5-phosphate isomerase B